MEILLDRGAVTVMGYGAVIAIFVMFLSLVGIVVAMCLDHYDTAGFCATILLFSIVFSCVFPEYTFDVPTKTHKYVVEITDAEKYKELVDNGYTLDKLYDNRDIYMMTGDVIE